jgi:hypothetical protein
MLERDRLSIKAFREETERAERAERERREKPIREAEARFNESSRRLAAVMQERWLGRVKDPDPVLDPTLNGIHMTRAQADAFNKNQFRHYREQNPDVYLTPELLDQFGDYWHVNGIGLVSVSMIAEIVSRYRDANLLPDPPQPEPEPEPVVIPASVPEPEPEQPSGPKVYVGRDWQTGREREFTAREVNRMSSAEYAKAFPVASTFTDLFTAMAQEREQQ